MPTSPHKCSNISGFRVFYVQKQSHIHKLRVLNQGLYLRYYLQTLQLKVAKTHYQKAVQRVSLYQHSAKAADFDLLVVNLNGVPSVKTDQAQKKKLQEMECLYFLQLRQVVLVFPDGPHVHHQNCQ